MKWIFVTQISCSRRDMGQWLWTQTLGVLMSWQYFQPHIFLFAQLSLTLVGTSFEQCEEWISQLFSLLTLLTSVLIDETISSSHAWHWPADGCGSLMTQLPGKTNHLPPSHHYISCMSPQPHSLPVSLSLLWLHHDGRGSDKISLLYPDH